MDLKSIKEFFKKISPNMMSISIVLLAAAIFYFAVALFNFTHEVSKVRRELPNTLNRIDRQIADVQKMTKSFEKTGQDFQSGMNKGISQGIVDVPLNTVANVGYAVSNTAVKTGKETVNLWQGAKDRLFFWSKKPSPTVEVEQKK